MQSYLRTLNLLWAEGWLVVNVELGGEVVGDRKYWSRHRHGSCSEGVWAGDTIYEVAIC